MNIISVVQMILKRMMCIHLNNLYDLQLLITQLFKIQCITFHHQRKHGRPISSIYQWHFFPLQGAFSLPQIPQIQGGFAHPFVEVCLKKTLSFELETEWECFFNLQAHITSSL